MAEARFSLSFIARFQVYILSGKDCVRDTQCRRGKVLSGYKAMKLVAGRWTTRM